MVVRPITLQYNNIEACFEGDRGHMYPFLAAGRATCFFFCSPIRAMGVPPRHTYVVICSLHTTPALPRPSHLPHLPSHWYSPHPSVFVPNPYPGDHDVRGISVEVFESKACVHGPKCTVNDGSYAGNPASDAKSGRNSASQTPRSSP